MELVQPNIQDYSEDTTPLRRRSDIAEVCKETCITWEKGMMIMVGFVAVVITIAVSVAWSIQGRMTSLEYKVENIAKDVSIVRIEREKEIPKLDTLISHISSLHEELRTGRRIR